MEELTPRYEISDLHFQLCKIFLDETNFRYQNRNHFVWGALLVPIDSDIGVKLGLIRKKYCYLHTFHFNEISKIDEKGKKTIKEFLTTFIDSNVCFRGIIVNSETWNQISEYKSQARLAGLLLSYPWIPYKGKIYKTLSRARIIFDERTLTPQQKNEFKEELNKMLKKKNKIEEFITYPIKDAAISFADKRIFDELQLVDIINGIIRSSFLLANGGNISRNRKEIHDFFLKKFPNLKNFVKWIGNLQIKK